MKRQALPTIDNCSGCGACCMEQVALPIHLVRPDAWMKPVRPLPPALRQELLDTIDRFQREGWPADGTPCIWFDQDAKKCKHYEHRPELCRDGLKVGDEGCRRWRRQYGIDPVNKYGFVKGKLVRT